MASSRKKSLHTDPKAIHSSITDALVTVKAQVTEPSRPLPIQAHDDLLKLASLAEYFTREKNRKTAAQFMDSLDQEGVNLWNSSLLVRPDENSDAHQKKSFSLIRLAALRLIEAGTALETASIEILIRLLQLANKTAACLSACDQIELVASVMITAAQLEGELQKVNDPDEQYIKPRAAAIVSYYSSRMEGAWKEDNESVGYFMLGQAINNQNLQHLDAQELELLASKILDIGKDILRSGTTNDQIPDGMTGPRRASLSVKWIQKALLVSERVRDKDTLGVDQLKMAILKSLARAYFHSSSAEPDNLAKSEATLEELTAISTDRSRDLGEQQQFRWMKLSILKRRNASEQELIGVFKNIIDHMTFSESNITDLLQEIRLHSSSYTIVTTVNQILLERALDSEDHLGHQFVDRILLSQIFCLKEHKEHQVAMNDLQNAFSAVSKYSTFALDKTATIACQSLMFQVGTKLFQGKQYPQAADWFILCTHTGLKSVSSSGDAKCFRKAALCHIHSGAYAQASAIISRCPGHEASTHYLSFLAAAYQGQEKDAIVAVGEMIKAPDFDRKMLLLATQLAHENQMKDLLLSALGGLLKTMKENGSLESELEGMTLIRCMIRIVSEMTKDHGADLTKLLPTLLNYFQTARDLVFEARAKRSVTLITKDISWLWRTAYNTAIRGCSGWDESIVAEMFSCARQLMDVYSKAVVGDSETNLSFYMAMASFSTICGRVFHTRQKQDISSEVHSNILKEIASFRDIAIQHRANFQAHDVLKQIDSLTSLSFVFEVEQLSAMKDWERVGQAIQNATESKVPTTLDTFEAIADILWIEPICPTPVLYATLEAILKTCLEHGNMDCDKFSRWLRAIVSILLSRNIPSDREKALGYVEQASDVIKDNQADDEYPQDERAWLLTTSYNCGVEFLQISDLEHAKRWFEAATLIARYTQGGDSRAEQIEESYQHLLARYGQRTKPTV